MDNFHQKFNFIVEPYFSAFETENLVFYSHLHKQFEILFVLDGEITVTVEDNKKTLCKSEICIIKGNQIHSYYTENYSKAFIIIFEPDIVLEFTNLFRNSKLENPFINLKK